MLNNMSSYLKITKDLDLSGLANIVGERNIDQVLNVNGLERTVDIGQEFFSRTVDNTDIDYQQKIAILNQFVGDSDLFEKAALESETGWASLAQYNCFLDAIKIPDEIDLPESEGVLGNGEPIPGKVYQACIDSLTDSHQIDPIIFAEYNGSFSGKSFGVTSSATTSAIGEGFQAFKIPWGEVSLYSSLSDMSKSFPVYPTELSDAVSANYEEMPDMLYQYEPWQVYKSSGPREISFNFEFHRDMWTWDHRDGKANELVRFCKANCYPEYQGSLVNVSTVSLYIHGKNYITGIMTQCSADWSGPIGLDGFYLICKLSFTIKEVSPEALNYYTMMNKGLIG